jgi:hypothetical protein
MPAARGVVHRRFGIEFDRPGRRCRSFSGRGAAPRRITGSRRTGLPVSGQPARRPQQRHPPPVLFDCLPMGGNEG